MEENSSLSDPQNEFADDNKTVFNDFPKELLDFTGSCFIILAIIGTVGNVISICALSRSKKLKNATTIFVINLGVADLLFCCISMPLSAATYFQRNWNYGHVPCALFALLRYSNAILSMFSVVAVTINRYVHVVHPRSYNYLYSGRKIGTMIALLWISALMMLLPPLLGIWGKLGYDPRVCICDVMELNGKSPKNFYYISFAFVLPTIVFLVCYVRIYWVARTSSKNVKKFGDDINSRKSGNIFIINRQIFTAQTKPEAEQEILCQKQNKSDLRVLKMMLIIFITYIICYFPMIVVKVFKMEFKLPVLYSFGFLGIYLSNVTNPIIYIALSKKYRKAYKDLFCPNGAQASFSDTTLTTANCQN